MKQILSQFCMLVVCLLPSFCQADTLVRTASELVAAARDADKGSTIRLAPGTYWLSETLQLKAGVTLRGENRDGCVITHTPGWKPSTETLPKGEVRWQEAEPNAYLIRLANKADGITIANVTLRGPQLHGAIFAVSNKNVLLNHLKIEDLLYCGIRCYSMSESRISECEFIGAGGRWKKGGLPGVDGGISGGAIFATWMSASEIDNNRISYGDSQRRPGKSANHYGVKGRGGRNIHIHHNTIGVNFAIEFPFEGADNFEIDHNILNGVVSIPKYAGGKVPVSGKTFHLHHNYFTTSYAIEFVRNGVEIDHNLFDFDTQADGGNLISGFGRAPADGPALFHNNLVNNPGRGVIWINEPYDNLVIRHNHIVTRTTATPRQEGLFGLNPKSDFETIEISNNIIECKGQSRPLMRNEASYAATVRGNQFQGVSDSDRFANPKTEREGSGLEHPLRFRCGVHGEMQVDGWNTSSQTMN